MSGPSKYELGWRLGRSSVPRGVELWVPYDRTAGVYGPQCEGFRDSPGLSPSGLRPARFAAADRPPTQIERHGR